MHEKIRSIVDQVKTIILDKEDVIVKVVSAWIAGGHVLIEDVPGTGKTILARSLAQSADCAFSRVQFTPDLLPSDILGVSIFNQKSGEFDFHQGPIFTSFLLGDEINRATPKTQSALLEAMSEGQISVEGHRFKLDPLFFVIATQNPIEQLGTFELPEAQMDRFMMCLTMGYPSPGHEIQMIKDQLFGHPVDSLEPVVTKAEVMQLREESQRVTVSEEILQYISQLVQQTRNHESLKIGVSPRGMIALVKASQALSLCMGLDYVRPSIVQALVPNVFAHRIQLTSDAHLKGISPERLLQEIIKSVAVPRGD
ncbi:MAG: MoxR family ATPase [Bdellovibrionales bacterium]